MRFWNSRHAWSQLSDYHKNGRRGQIGSLSVGGHAEQSIEDMLRAAPKPSPVQDHSLIYLTSTIENDHEPAYFRLYRNPSNRRSWLLIKKADVVGDLYEWTADETIQKGFSEAKIHRVSLKVGTKVQ